MGLRDKRNGLKMRVRRLVPGSKEREEIAYWRARKAQQVQLKHDHYEFFYTEFFGLSYDDYQGKSVLDIGCGPRGSLEWAEMTAERVGLDTLVDAYRELGIDDHRMTYVKGAAENIPFPDGHFDIVATFNSLDHVDDIDRTVVELARVVKPGGLLLLLTELNHSPRVSEPQSFGWEILERLPGFDVEWHRRNRKFPERGMYQSLVANEPYESGEGILAARIRRVDSV